MEDVGFACVSMIIVRIFEYQWIVYLLRYWHFNHLYEEFVLYICFICPHSPLNTEHIRHTASHFVSTVTHTSLSVELLHTALITLRFCLIWNWRNCLTHFETRNWLKYRGQCPSEGDCVDVLTRRFRIFPDIFLHSTLVILWRRDDGINLRGHAPATPGCKEWVLGIGKFDSVWKEKHPENRIIYAWCVDTDYLDITKLWLSFQNIVPHSKVIGAQMLKMPDVL